MGYNSYVYDWENGRLVRKGVDEARVLMEQAGYANGIDQETGESLILYFDTVSRGPDTKALLNWMVKQFAKIDIQLVIRGTDGNRFFEKLNKKHKIDVVCVNGENAANYTNPEFDELFDQMKNMENSPERLQIIRQMNEIVRADAPWVFAFNPKAYSLYHGWYKNVKPNMMANNTLKYKRVDPIQRAQERAAWNKPILWPLYLVLVVLIVTIVPAVRGFYLRERARAL